MADQDIIEKALAAATELDQDSRKETGSLIRDLVAELIQTRAEATSTMEEYKRYRLEQSGHDLSTEAISVARKLMTDHDVPVSAFFDDHVSNVIIQRNQARLQVDNLITNLQNAMDLVKVHWNIADPGKAQTIERFQKALDDAQPHKYLPPSGLKQTEET